MTPGEQAAVFIKICEAGFDSPEHWQNWAKKHKAQIDALPVPLRKKVWLAWDQSTAREFSKPVRK